MAVKISPAGRRQFTDSSGNPISGGKLFYYASGSTTKQTTYTTSVGDVANSNPIVLNSSGRTPYGVWFTVGETYKEVLAPSTDADPPTSAIYTEDVISGVNDSTTTIDQWVSGVTPTYISATSLSLVGDQTSTYHVGRRLKTTNTAGTIYSTITVSAYTTLTTLTVVNDSGTLDSGLSAVSYGLLSATNISIPKFTSATGATAGVLALSGGNLTGGVNQARGNITQHATTMDFFAVASPDILDGTGSAVTITACVNAPQAGATRKFYPLLNTILTHGATFDIGGNANLTAATGDCWVIETKAGSVNTFRAYPIKEDGTAAVASSAPFADSTALVKGSADATKLLAFDVGGFTTGTTRTVTPPDRNMTLGTTLATEQLTTTGTSKDFTGIPSGVRWIDVMLVGVSSNGTSDFLIQLGDAGGFEITDYTSGCKLITTAVSATLASAAGFAITAGNTAAFIHTGTIRLNLENAATFRWVSGAMLHDSSSNYQMQSAGAKPLSAELTQLRFTTVNGTDAFDLGAINISYGF